MSEIKYIEETPEGNFPINSKLIQKYQQAEHSIKSKYIDGTYHKVYFCGGNDIDLKLIVS